MPRGSPAEAAHGRQTSTLETESTIRPVEKPSVTLEGNKGFRGRRNRMEFLLGHFDNTACADPELAEQQPFGMEPQRC